jgi:hypothetical protein
MRRRPPIIVCAPFASAALVGCLLKPTAPTGTTDGGPTVDGSGTHGDSSPPSPCLATLVDNFMAVPSQCGMGASVSNGNLILTDALGTSPACSWQITVGHAVMVAITSMTTTPQSGAIYDAMGQMILFLPGAPHAIARIHPSNSSTDLFPVDSNPSSFMLSGNAESYLLLEAPDDKTLIAKASAVYTPNLDSAGWQTLNTFTVPGGGAQGVNTVQLQYSGTGSGSGSVAFTMFATCK